ncbi:MAG TPA: lysylphosphatidylglycerol synthase transmembrane domain-containing protein [Miltoncostaeaceae bacterium]|nr:lysylphosphatidylglycerol synthase transmembrane domain-containing protein [Miltoncostaeaceae bacterium]
MDSIRSFVDAVNAFGERLAAVHWGFLVAAAALGIVNLALRSRGWQNILRAAFPGERIRYRSAFGAYCAGVGVNAVLPARAGDLMKMFLMRRSVPHAGYATLTGTLVCETIVDMIIASTLLGWALAFGILPGVRLPDLPAFDLSLALRHPFWALAIAGVVAILFVMLGRRVRRFWHEFGRGLVILTTPLRYLRSVVSYQVAGWGCRVGAAACFLLAFGIPASITAALTVQVAGSLGGLFPATPGGLGPKQALLVVMLAGEAGRTDVLAFSAGMELTLIVVNAVLGLTCLALMLRHMRFMRAIREARGDRGNAAPEGR